MNSLRMLAADTFATTAWMGIRILALAAWIWVLVAYLPAEGFGWLTTFAALAATGALLAHAGIPYLFFEEQGREATTFEVWRQSLGAILIAAPVMAGLSTLFLLTLAAVPVPIAALLVFLAVWVDVAASATLQAIALRGHAARKMHLAAGLPAMLVLGRLMASLAVPAIVELTAIPAMAAYLAAQSVMSIMTVAIAWRVSTNVLGQTHGKPLFPGLVTIRRAWRFALMGGTSLAMGELDKPLVSRVLGLGVAGHYALAYRIATTLATPATALSAAMIPRWSRMRRAGDGGRLSRTFAWLWFATLASGGVVAWTAHALIGEVPVGAFGLYAEAWPLMQALAWLVPLLALHQLSSAALLAMGRPVTRSMIDMLSYLILASAVITLSAGLPIQTSQLIPAACILAELTAVAAGACAVVLASRAIDTGGSGG